MAWFENLASFGTHAAVSDHRCCGSIGVVVYAAVGSLTGMFGSSPTARRYASSNMRLYGVPSY